MKDWSFLCHQYKSGFKNIVGLSIINVEQFFYRSWKSHSLMLSFFSDNPDRLLEIHADHPIQSMCLFLWYYMPKQPRLCCCKRLIYGSYCKWTKKKKTLFLVQSIYKKPYNSNWKTKIIQNKSVSWASVLRTLYCQKHSLICLYTHMNLSDIPFLIHRVYIDVGLPFAAMTASTLLGKLSTRFRSVLMGIFNHSSRSALWGQTLMLDEKAWLAVSALIHPKSVLLGCRPVKFFHTKLTHSCLYGPCFVHWCSVKWEQEGAIPKLFPQSWEHEIVQNLLVYWSI